MFFFYFFIFFFFFFIFFYFFYYLYFFFFIYFIFILYFLMVILTTHSNIATLSSIKIFAIFTKIQVYLRFHKGNFVDSFHIATISTYYDILQYSLRFKFILDSSTPLPRKIYSYSTITKNYLNYKAFYLTAYVSY